MCRLSLRRSVRVGEFMHFQVRDRLRFSGAIHRMHLRVRTGLAQRIQQPRKHRRAARVEFSHAGEGGFVTG